MAIEAITTQRSRQRPSAADAPVFERLLDGCGCPLCGSQAQAGVDYAAPNLYSEKLAALLACDERSLIAALPNQHCARCGLWYKARWFDQATLAQLFGDCVPVHPKGWDALGARFSRANFEAELALLSQALAAGEHALAARHRRGLISIVQSLVGVADTVAGDALCAALARDDLGFVQAALTRLPQDFGAPFAFRRFSGFSADALWVWVESKLGAVKRYAEVGCPLWGQLAPRAQRGVACWTLDRAESNYWGAQCRQNGQHCAQALCAAAPVQAADWAARDDLKLELIGALQYLDHLDRPLDFVAECFKAAPALLLILDGVDAPSAIQHRSGWNAAAIAWLAAQFGKTVHADFAAIGASGHRAWLLADA